MTAAEYAPRRPITVRLAVTGIMAELIYSLGFVAEHSSTMYARFGAWLFPYMLFWVALWRIPCVFVYRGLNCGPYPVVLHNLFCSRHNVHELIRLT